MRYMGKRQKGIALLFVLCTLMTAFSGCGKEIGDKSEITSSSIKKTKQQIVTTNSLSLLRDAGFEIGREETEYHGFECSSEIAEKFSNKTIIIEKKVYGKNLARAVFSDSPVDRTIKISISGIEEGGIVEEDIYRINDVNGQIYNVRPKMITPTPTSFPSITPAGGGWGGGYDDGLASNEDFRFYEFTDDADMVEAITITDSAEESNTRKEEIELMLDRTYAYEFYEDDNYYYVILRRPKDVYKKIVVIDAGHGGKDAGAISKDNRYYEKNIALEVTNQIKEILEEQTDIKVYCTRTEDRKLTLSQRVRLANDTEADLFLSVHCNSEVGTTLNGIEVLYSSKNDSEPLNSKEFAAICNKHLKDALGDNSNGLIDRYKNVSIIRYSTVPVALCELGYLSNIGDLSKLTNHLTMNRTANSLAEAILEAYQEIEK